MGVTVAPGGDGGPAGSVPEMMGLREFDAFLLVVDDVPWGGAYNPLSLDDRPRERGPDRDPPRRGTGHVRSNVVRGGHPRHPPRARLHADARSRVGRQLRFLRSGRVRGSPSAGKWQHSISASYDTVGYKDERTSYDRGHLLYRGLTDVGQGS